LEDGSDAVLILVQAPGIFGIGPVDRALNFEIASDVPCPWGKYAPDLCNEVSLSMVSGGLTMQLSSLTLSGLLLSISTEEVLVSLIIHIGKFFVTAALVFLRGHRSDVCLYTVMVKKFMKVGLAESKILKLKD
jgi:hypothetical protein